MSEINLGRVQGGSVFFALYSSPVSAARVTFSKSLISPENIVPLVGDCVLFTNGDLRKITAVLSSQITCGNIVANLKGAKGDAILRAYSGRCNTSSAAYEKEIIIDESDNVEIYRGAIIRVQFSNSTEGSSLASIRFKVGSNSALVKDKYGNTLTCDSPLYIPNNGIVVAIFDGTYWNIVSGLSGRVYEQIFASQPSSSLQSDTIDVGKSYNYPRTITVYGEETQEYGSIELYYLADSYAKASGEDGFWGKSTLCVSVKLSAGEGERLYLRRQNMNTTYLRVVVEGY